MSDIGSKLMTGEEVVFQTKKHWAAPVADSWKAVLLILGSLVLAWLQTDAAVGVMGFVNRILGLLELGLFLGGAGWIVYNIVAWRTAEYAVTNQRVLGQEGLIRSRSTDSLLTSISDVRMKISAVGRMLHYGDLTILSASGQSGADSFTSVRDVETLKKTILEQKLAAAAGTIKSAASQVAAAAASAAPATAESAVMANIASLAELRDSGAISADEYEAKKADLLSRI